MSDLNTASAVEDTSSSAEFSADDAIDSFDYVDGKLEIKWNEDETEEVADETADTPTTPEPAKPETPAEVDPRDKRIYDLQAGGTRLAQENARLREHLAYLQGQAKAAPKDVPLEPEKAPLDPLELLSDGKKFDAYVNERAQDIARGVIEKEIGKYQRHFEDMEYGNELRDAVAQYGPDFINRTDQIRTILNRFPNQLNFHQAYSLAREFFPTATGSESTPAQRPQEGTPAADGKAPASRKVDINELKQRAARNPETGVAGADVTEPTREPRDLREAFNMALAGKGR